MQGIKIIFKYVNLIDCDQYKKKILKFLETIVRLNLKEALNNKWSFVGGLIVGKLIYILKIYTCEFLTLMEMICITEVLLSYFSFLS